MHVELLKHRVLIGFNYLIVFWQRQIAVLQCVPLFFHRNRIPDFFFFLSWVHSFLEQDYIFQLSLQVGVAMC